MNIGSRRSFVRRVATWARRIGAITLFVEDLREAKRFYSEVFGLTAAFEDDHSVAFNVAGTIVNLPAARGCS